MASGVHTSLLSAGYRVSTAGVSCVWAALLGWKKVCFGWIHGHRLILSRGSVAGTHSQSPDHSRGSRRTLSCSNVIDLFRVVVARSCRNSSWRCTRRRGHPLRSASFLVEGENSEEEALCNKGGVLRTWLNQTLSRANQDMLNCMPLTKVPAAQEMSKSM